MENREKVIVRTSIIGILANILLVTFKMVVGLAANSIAVILDAINNLSDALSSVITIVGAKLASKSPTRKHPLGFGRIEYFSALLVSGIVLYAGITSAVESVKKIIHPEEANYTTVSCIIIAAAVVVKLILGLYVKGQGKKVNSGALEASGSDALFDAVLSASVLASAIIFMVFGISLEAYVGALISAFIIKAGIEMMLDTLNELMGHRDDVELTKKIKKLIAEDENVRGAYDLILYNYGPEMNYGSVHIEVADTMSVKELDILSRKLSAKVYAETGVYLTGISVYSYNTGDNKVKELEDEIRKLVISHDFAVQIHGFYLDEETHTIRFDTVLSFDISQSEGVRILREELTKKYPQYIFAIVPDVDFSVT
ncbi:MAG: cation transporter [Lachnospiraceae bacterium]|nr:cation transporter [Lachnospiraceae bacterium]